MDIATLPQFESLTEFLVITAAIVVLVYFMSRSMIKRIGLWFQKNPERIPLCIGILCLLAAGALLVNPVRLVMQGRSAEGIVTDVVARTVHGKIGRDEWTATIRFKAGDRNTTIQRSWEEDRGDRGGIFVCISGCYSKGEKLRVRYLADDPDIAAVDSFVGLFGTSLILGLMGAMGVFFWWLWRSERSEVSEGSPSTIPDELNAVEKLFERGESLLQRILVLLPVAGHAIGGLCIGAVIGYMSLPYLLSLKTFQSLGALLGLNIEPADVIWLAPSLGAAIGVIGEVIGFIVVTAWKTRRLGS